MLGPCRRCVFAVAVSIVCASSLAAGPSGPEFVKRCQALIAQFAFPTAAAQLKNDERVADRLLATIADEKPISSTLARRARIYVMLRYASGSWKGEAPWTSKEELKSDCQLLKKWIGDDAIYDRCLTRIWKKLENTKNADLIEANREGRPPEDLDDSQLKDLLLFSWLGLSSSLKANEPVAKDMFRESLKLDTAAYKVAKAGKMREQNDPDPEQDEEESTAQKNMLIMVECMLGDVLSATERQEALNLWHKGRNYLDITDHIRSTRERKK